MIVITVKKASLAGLATAFAALAWFSTCNTTWAHSVPDITHLFLIQDTPLYDHRNESEVPSGALSAYQTVQVDSTHRGVDGDPDWFLVDTWQGAKWIPAHARMVVGEVQAVDKTITSETTVSLYDQPDKQDSNLSVSPQLLHASAILSYLPVTFSNTFSLQAGSGTWYQVDTWLGKKWIHNPQLLENVKETPVSYNLKLTGTENAYLHPFTDPASREQLQPQVVQVVAEWDTRGPFSGSLWLKLQLPEGERWIAPQHPTLRDYQEIKEPVTLPTETRYFQQPQLNPDGNDWLASGTYDAFEASGDWVHLNTQHGQVWVNPKRALLERPPGITPKDKRIDLTSDSTTYRYPLTGEVFHQKGFYAPQTVQAFETWTSDEGEHWYHFHGFGGDEWVMVL